MKVAHACGYYSELAVKAGKPRPRDPPFWEAYMFCRAVKSGEFHRDFYIERAAGRLSINRKNFNLVRPVFGEWVAKKLLTFSVPVQPLSIVPVPSKDALAVAATYRSFEMAQQALKGTGYENCVLDALRWNKPLEKAHEGGTRKRADLLPLLDAKTDIKGKPIVKGKQVVLIDDLVTTGGSLLACQDRLTAAGATVLGAITCGRTVYDDTEPPFGAREFELTAELSDISTSGSKLGTAQ
jgi:hypothetical protein